MGDRKPPAFVCWLDLETAGTDEKADPILEVGAAICRNTPLMEVVEEYETAVWPGQLWMNTARWQIAPVVDDMHTGTGLWSDVAAATHPIEHVDDELSRLLVSVTGSRDHVALAGSGVGHFDRRFLVEQMPQTNARFTYWSLDVGVLRRYVERIHPDLIVGDHDDAKAHRGLADAYDHRREWLAYERLGQQLINGAPA